MAIIATTCMRCGSPSLIRCTHPALDHPPDCPAYNFGQGVSCPPGNGCCDKDHDHEAAANACPGAGGNHPGAACTWPNGGRVCTIVTPPGQLCPGGHCGPGVPGCQVCRSLHVQVLDAGLVKPVEG